MPTGHCGDTWRGGGTFGRAGQREGKMIAGGTKEKRGALLKRATKSCCQKKKNGDAA